ncbi:hypothetical protein AZI85_04510 [Bdellovibrio bacteriovorus]|uniref:Uncharacterized protein n=1 Tax=Bdellovibrio bacteriovorus TaxID=959 RepID=A0A150WII3_BDEBC|nr:hypothetical protein [Bdellovibrio bacteriovorus]KYG63299.1 hypothetical protein AZI85_04510 [Bdellovibrio bacteriovorus]
MEYSKINYFEKTDSPKHREFIISQNNCILCGTVLELKHIADRATGEITEEAFCTQCEVKTRNKTHVLN